jgi:hypothetical protein
VNFCGRRDDEWKGRKLIGATYLLGSRNSSVVWGWATGCMVGGSSPSRGWKFSHATMFRPALGPVVTRGSLLGEKRPGDEADHSTPSRAESKNAWSYTSTPQIRLHDVVLS